VRLHAPPHRAQATATTVAMVRIQGVAGGMHRKERVGEQSGLGIDREDPPRS